MRRFDTSRGIPRAGAGGCCGGGDDDGGYRRALGKDAGPGAGAGEENDGLVCAMLGGLANWVSLLLFLSDVL